jgi:hypothetical protein
MLAAMSFMALIRVAHVLVAHNQMTVSHAARAKNIGYRTVANSCAFGFNGNFGSRFSATKSMNTLNLGDWN